MTGGKSINWTLLCLSIVLVLQVLIFILILRTQDNVVVVRDKLDTVVVVGFGSPSKTLPTCLAALNVYAVSVSSSQNCADLDWRIAPGEDAPIWAWAANSRDTSKNQSGKTIIFSVVDTDGVPVLSEFASVVPNTIISGEDGIGATIVRFIGTSAGVYRVRAEYADRSARSFAYSPNIIVQSN